MTDTISIQKINEVYVKVSCPADLAHELSEYFSFRPKGYQFSPKFKNRIWDGYIHLFKVFQKTLYVGLVPYVKKFCEDRGYELILDQSIQVNNHVEPGYTKELVEMVNGPYEPRDYQEHYIESAIRDERGVMLSPTSSGKSYMIYLLAMHYNLTQDMRSLIIVPTKILLNQMKEDFVEYGANPDDIHKVQGSKGAESDCKFVITTWHTAAKMGPEWFAQFGVLFGDEAHLFAAKSLQGLMEKTTTIRYKFGLSGTLDGTKVHKLTLEGLFGTVRKFVSTKQLMKDGSVAKLKIYCLVLNYSREDVSYLAKLKRKVPKGQASKKYSVEKGFLMLHEKRNKFIRNLAWSFKGKNNLIMFDEVEKHGKVLEPILECDERHLHFIHGTGDKKVRDNVKEIVENSFDNDILASSGIFSTGVSIKRIHNLISCMGGKSQIKLLQSIGRLLRKGNDADDVVFYDISDNLTYGGKPNYSLEHLHERVKIYDQEGFDYKIITVDI